MDGDICVDTEPGMGSQFTIRIPLYSAQYPAKATVEGLSDKRCWLAVNNASLFDFLTSLLGQSGLRVSRYEGQTPDVDDMLITDAELEQPWAGRGVVRFCRRYIGIPVERSPGEWVHSVANPHELLGLLARIYSVALDEGEGAAALPSPESLASVNDDMMILVVDDHPINRRLLADQLGSLGYQCKTANDGVDALNVLSKNHIDIVLSDVNMPNMDGYRLTQRIRQLGLTLPVLGSRQTRWRKKSSGVLNRAWTAACLSRLRWTC